MQRVLRCKSVLDVDDDGAGPHGERREVGVEVEVEGEMWIVEAEVAAVEVQEN